MVKTNRNDPCPCGSGLKYKKCCGKADAERQQKRRSKFSFGSKVGQKPSFATAFANKVMKVLSSPMSVPSPVTKSEPAPAGSSTGYSSLEELIGVEGPPPNPVTTAEESSESAKENA